MMHDLNTIETIWVLMVSLGGGWGCGQFLHAFVVALFD